MSFFDLNFSKVENPIHQNECIIYTTNNYREENI